MGALCACLGEEYWVYILGMSIPHALLALLDRGPSFGLRLREDFEAWTGEVWPLNVGQVYSTLRRLERDGLIHAEGGETERERFYELAPPGRRELAEWLMRRDGGAPLRDELVIKVLMALAVDSADAVEVIQTHRRFLVEQMQGFTRAKAATGREELSALLVLDAHVLKAESMVRWLDMCEQRIASAGTLDVQPRSGSRSAPSIRSRVVGGTDTDR